MVWMTAEESVEVNRTKSKDSCNNPTSVFS